MYWQWTVGRQLIEAASVPVAPLPTIDDEPITVANARLHLNEPPATDPEIERYIRTARYAVEQRSGIALVEQTWDVFLNIDSSLIYPGWIALPLSPIQSIVEVAAIATSGVETIIAGSNYWVNRALRPASLVFGSTLSASNGVRVRYIAGLDTADETTIPPDLIAAMYLHIAHQWAHRGDDDAPEEPPAFTRILDRYVLPTVA